MWMAVRGEGERDKISLIQWDCIEIRGVTCHQKDSDTIPLESENACEEESESVRKCD